MKTAVITGASRGIGKATAEKFLAEGWRVLGTHLNTSPTITHENFVSIPYDQADSESVARVTEEIMRIAPIVDVLVNNAAIMVDAEHEGVDLAKVRATFEADLFGLIDFTERLVPSIVVGGHVVNIDSTYGSFSFPIDDATSLGYRMAKAALNMYTRSLAFRLKESNIIVSSLDPGWVDTAMGQIAATPEEGPGRAPQDAALDVYSLVITNAESGYFWKLGKKRSW